MGWRDIDVHREASGQPFVVLEGGAKQLAAERGVSAVWIASVTPITTQSR